MSGQKTSSKTAPISIQEANVPCRLYLAGPMSAFTGARAEKKNEKVINAADQGLVPGEDSRGPLCREAVAVT